MAVALYSIGPRVCGKLLLPTSPHLHSFLTICVGPLWMKHWRGCAQIGLCWIWSTGIEDHNLIRAHDGVDMQNHSDGYAGQVETFYAHRR